MKFLVNGQVKEVTAREWTGSEYKPDCFGDIAQTETAGMIYNNENDAWETTEERFNEIVEWWTAEFENWGNGFNDAGAEFEPVNMTLEVTE